VGYRIRADVLCHVVETRKWVMALMIGETFSPKCQSFTFSELPRCSKTRPVFNLLLFLQGGNLRRKPREELEQILANG
jgi:hypothetical protein